MNATAQILVASPVVHLYREQSVHKIPALDGVLQLYNADNTAAVKKAVQSLKDLLPSYNDAEQHDAGRFMLDILSSQCLHCGSSKCTFLQRYKFWFYMNSLFYFIFFYYVNLL